MALLAIDVGNTQTVFGLFEGDELRDHWRVATERNRSGDELGALFASFLDLSTVDGIALASTVPQLHARTRISPRSTSGRSCSRSGRECGPACRSAMTTRARSGPDRIANAVAAVERYGPPAIVVDFGTSTNFDVVSPAGEYVGGVLAPGIEVSMDALFARAARLFKVDFAEPETVIAKNTASSLQSGLVYGFAGQVDGIVDRIRDELGAEAQTIATGGLADLIVPHARTLETIDPFLTLEGVRLVWLRNHD
jgi:type III pantothenate kinase